jgi:hypothetical protein
MTRPRKIGALVGQVIGGGVGGAILAILAGVTKWMLEAA